MKTINLILLSCLAIGPAQAESAAGIDRNQPPTAAERPNKPDKQGPKDDRGDRPSKEEFLAKFDTDGDGQLSNVEKQAAREARQQDMLVRRFDADRDGVLSAEEQAKADAALAEREAKLLTKFDQDGDGLLSEEERQAARRAMRNHGQQRPGEPPQGKASSAGPNRNGPPRSDQAESAIAPPPR